MDYVKVKLKLSGDVRTVTADEAEELLRRKSAVLVKDDVETATTDSETETAVRTGDGEQATKLPAPETTAKPGKSGS